MRGKHQTRCNRIIVCHGGVSNVGDGDDDDDGDGDDDDDDDGDDDVDDDDPQIPVEARRPSSWWRWS